MFDASQLTLLTDKYPFLKSLIFNNIFPVSVSAFGESSEKNIVFVTCIVQNTAKLRTALTFTLYFSANPKRHALFCTKIRLNVGSMVLWFPSITAEITPDTLLRICRALHVFHHYIAEAVLNPARDTRKNSAARLLKRRVQSSTNLSVAALSRSLYRAMALTNPLTFHLVLKLPFTQDVATLAASMIFFALPVIISRLDLITDVRQKFQEF